MKYVTWYVVETSGCRWLLIVYSMVGLTSCEIHVSGSGSSRTLISVWSLKGRSLIVLLVAYRLIVSSFFHSFFVGSTSEVTFRSAVLVVG